MGNGIQPVAPRMAGPIGLENIESSGNVGETNPKQVEREPQAGEFTQPHSSNPGSRKLEQSLNGAALRAELEGRYERNIERGEAMKGARSILDNPLISNEGKIAELQKMLGKSGRLEFEQFFKQIGNFSVSQRQLVNSAISESPKIMERIAEELHPGTQLSVVSDAILNPL